MEGDRCSSRDVMEVDKNSSKLILLINILIHRHIRGKRTRNEPGIVCRHSFGDHQTYGI